MPFLHAFAVSLDDRSHRVRKPGGGAISGFALAAALVALLKASVVGAVTIGSGFSAMWFDPARNGEGLQLEILDTNLALVEWFTYNEQGGQRWFQGVGQIVHGASADSIEFPQLYVTHGGHFGPTFNPADVQIQPAGDATLTFSDCNTGTFRYDAFGQSQALPIQRLTQTMGAGCTPINGVPGQPVMAYAGQSGSWFDVSHSGEGFELQWLTNNQALAIWYTYDTSGNQVWLEGVGSEQNGAIVFEQMARTHGPHFGAAYDPASFRPEDWGTLTLQLDCNQGTAHYASSQTGFGSGDLTLTRLTKLKQPDCPTVKPKLSDLYTITWDDLPIDLGTPQIPNYLAAESIAEDGTIAGRREDHLVLWHPDTRNWEDVQRELAAAPVYISPDASAVVATDAISADQALPLHTMLWERSTGWQAMLGDVVSRSIHYSVSQNFKYVAGNGHNEGGEDQVWIRAIDGVQWLLPASDALPAGMPFAVSNNGNTAVGAALRFPTDFPEFIAARWDSDRQPSVLHSSLGEELSVATACNGDCSVIFGCGLYDYDPNHPHPGEAWYLKNDGGFGYLGALPDAPITGRSYAVSDATADGSLAVGNYSSYANADQPDSGTTTRAFIWTQATGIVSVRSLVTELGIGDDDWNEVDAMRLSPDGLKILIGGVHIPQEGQIDHTRAVVLQLAPKSASD